MSSDRLLGGPDSDMRHGGDRGGSGMGGGSAGGGGFSYPPFGSFSSLGGGGGLPGLPTSDAQLNTTPMVSWTFAGFADGTVAVFDERVPNYPLTGGGGPSLPAGGGVGIGSHHHHRVPSTVPAGRVHCSRDHSAWVVSAHLRADGVPEVIIIILFLGLHGARI